MDSITKKELLKVQSDREYINELQVMIEKAYKEHDFSECMVLRTLQQHYMDEKNMILEEEDARIIYTFVSKTT